MGTIDLLLTDSAELSYPLDRELYGVIAGVNTFLVVGTGGIILQSDPIETEVYRGVSFW